MKNNSDYSKGESKRWHVFAENINSDEKYANKVFTNYDFAKDELSKIGIKIDDNMHKQIKQAYEELGQASSKMNNIVRPLGGARLVTKVMIW